jgi:DNA-binding transcriptional LysR family regulator
MEFWAVPRAFMYNKHIRKRRKGIVSIMEFRQLEALKLISDTGSFSETAKQMGVTQPTVSAQISALEQEFGVKLLTRQPGKAAPTEIGRALYGYAVEILALRNEAIAAYGRRHEAGGAVTIAASSIPYQFVLPILMAQFSMKYPDAVFSLIGGNSAGVAALVAAGKADIGIAGAVFPGEEVSYEPILKDELMLITPAGPPYTQWPQGAVRMDDILRMPFVAREVGSGTWAEVEHYLAKQGYDSGALQVVARMDNPDAILKAVEQGLGIAILSSLAAGEYRRKGNILSFPLAGEPVKRDIYLVRAKGRKIPPIAEVFARFISQPTGGLTIKQ